MYIFLLLFVGLVVGVAAKLLVPGRVGGDTVTTMLLGVAGSVIAGLIGHALGWYHGVWSSAGLLASFGGAMLLIFVYRLIVGPRGSTVGRS